MPTPAVSNRQSASHGQGLSGLIPHAGGIPVRFTVDWERCTAPGRHAPAGSRWAGRRLEVGCVRGGAAICPVPERDDGGARTPPPAKTVARAASRAASLRRSEAHQDAGRAGHRHREAAQESADHRVGKALQNHVVHSFHHAAGLRRPGKTNCNDDAGSAGRVRCDASRCIAEPFGAGSATRLSVPRRGTGCGGRPSRRSVLREMRGKAQSLRVGDQRDRARDQGGGDRDAVRPGHRHLHQMCGGVRGVILM